MPAVSCRHERVADMLHGHGIAVDTAMELLSPWHWKCHGHGIGIDGVAVSQLATREEGLRPPRVSQLGFSSSIVSEVMLAWQEGCL